MNNLKALIIDDEPLAHTVILEYAKKLPELEIVAQCYKATDAYHILNSQSIDLLFLDINMPKLKGLDFLRTLENPPLVIVTSAYEEYALEGYELQVCDYLLKPFRFDRFEQAVKRVENRLIEKNINTTEPEIEQNILIKVDKKFLQIELKTIQYLESYGNYVKVWIGDKYQITPRTLSSFETELNEANFMRIHKSFMVQKTMIEYLEGSNLKMKNQNLVPVGKSHKKKLKDWLKE